MEPEAHPLDGVRPRHALCPKCGYLPGGLEINGGVIVCPECGAVVSFELSPPVRSVRKPARRLTLWMLLAIALVMVGLYALM